MYSTADSPIGFDSPNFLRCVTEIWEEQNCMAQGIPGTSIATLPAAPLWDCNKSTDNRAAPTTSHHLHKNGVYLNLTLSHFQYTLLLELGAQLLNKATLFQLPHGYSQKADSWDTPPVHRQDSPWRAKIEPQGNKVPFNLVDGGTGTTACQPPRFDTGTLPEPKLGRCSCTGSNWSCSSCWTLLWSPVCVRQCNYS